MANLMDNATFIPTNGQGVEIDPSQRAQQMSQSFGPAPAQTQGMNGMFDMLQRARQNPQAFEQFVRQNNPQAYQRAMQIRNSANPRALVTEMARAQGLAPNVLRMFGL